MKKCRRCSKPATLHITEIREGKAVALHLCETCAREYLEAPAEENPLAASADLTAKLEELVQEGSEEALSQLSCPNCGMTFSEFRERGRFGCPGEYTAFKAQILPLLENIHEDTTHVGKRPRGRSAGVPSFSRMIQLRKELQEAIDCEDYETAANLRDAIAALEAEARANPSAPAPAAASTAAAEPPAPAAEAPPEKPPAKRRRAKPEQQPPAEEAP